MENNTEKKIEQNEKSRNLKEDLILEMVKGGNIIRQDDGSFYCTDCGRKVSLGHHCTIKD